MQTYMQGKTPMHMKSKTKSLKTKQQQKKTHHALELDAKHMRYEVGILF